MSENKHTPEPWTYYDDRKSTGRIEIVGFGKTVSRIYLSMPDEDVANARRIVACVNRLAQFTTEQIEDFGYDLFAEDRPRLVEAQNEIHLLKKQRDELLSALEAIANETAKAIADYCSNQGHYCLSAEIESGEWKEV